MFREYRPHNFGLSLRVDHSAGLNRLPCLIEGSDQSMDLIRVKRLGVPCEKCAHSLPTDDGKKVAQSLARGNGIRVFHVIASSGALQKSEERSRATTGSPKSRRLGLSVASPKEDARRKSLSSWRQPRGADDCPPCYSGQGPRPQDGPRRRCSDRAGPLRRLR